MHRRLNSVVRLQTAMKCSYLFEVNNRYSVSQMRNFPVPRGSTLQGFCMPLSEELLKEHLYVIEIFKSKKRRQLISTRFRNLFCKFSSNNNFVRNYSLYVSMFLQHSSFVFLPCIFSSLRCLLSLLFCTLFLQFSCPTSISYLQWLIVEHFLSYSCFLEFVCSKSAFSIPLCL